MQPPPKAAYTLFNTMPFLYLQGIISVLYLNSMYKNIGRFGL